MSIINWLIGRRSKGAKVRRAALFSSAGKSGRSKVCGHDGTAVAVARPGDLLVMQCTKPMSEGAWKSIQACVKAEMERSPGVRIMLIDDSWRVVISPKKSQA